MAAGLAHELNQPLSAARNYARGSVLRLRKNPNDDGKVVTALEHIASEVDRAAKILARVRDFVRKVEVELIVTSVNDVVEEAVAIIGMENQVHSRPDRL